MEVRRSSAALFVIVLVACAGAMWTGRSVHRSVAERGLPTARDLDEEDLPGADELGGDGGGPLDGDGLDEAGAERGRGRFDEVRDGEGGARGTDTGAETGPGAGSAAVTSAAGRSGASDGGASTRALPGATTATAAPPADVAADPPEPTGAIAGRVSDEEGGAVAGAHVKLVSGRRTYQQGRTDADGRYLLSAVAAGRYRLLARAAGFVDGAIEGLDLAPGEARAGVDVTLAGGSVVAGRVVGPEGEPVEGARVSREGGGAFGAIEVASGPDGRFEMRGLPPGRARLRAAHPRYLAPPPLAVVAPAADVLIALRAGGTVLGEVLGLDGAPAKVAVTLHDGRGRVLARSPREGRFIFEGLAAATYLLATERAAGAIARADVRLGAGERRRVDLVLEAGGTVAGACVDEGGEPVPDARVIAAAQGIAFSAEARTRADGRFAIEGLLDATYAVSVRPPARFSPPEPLAVVVANGSGPADLLFELRAGAAVEGRARAADGGPAGGARIGIYDLGGARLGAADADPSGRFRVASLPVGDATLYASAGGELARVPIRLHAGETLEMDLALAPAVTIRGTARLETGAPAARATVEARSSDGVVRRATRASREGAFALRDLYPGRYAVSARTSGAPGPPVEIEIGPGEELGPLDLVVR